MNPIRTALRLLLEAGRSWIDDRAPSMGAALAYYTMLSITPLVLIVVSIAGLVFGEQAARGEVVEQLGSLVGEEGASAVQMLLRAANRPAAGILSTLGGFAALLLGATTVFGELQSALDRVWRAPPPPPAGGLIKWFRTRVTALGMVLTLGFLIMVSLLAGAALTGLQRWWEPMFGSIAWLPRIVELVFSFGSVTVAFAAIYKLMPRVHIEWRDVWIGAVLTALLFTAGKTLIGLYLGSSGVASPFGAAGSLVALVVWVYWSAQIFLFGAELTRVYAQHKGRFTPPEAVSVPV